MAVKKDSRTTPEGDTSQLAQYFSAHTDVIPTACPAQYSQTIEVKLKPLLPKFFRKTLASLRLASIHAWKEFELHRNASSKSGLVHAYELNLRAQEAEFKEAHRTFGVVMARIWPKPHYIKKLLVEVNEARCGTSAQLILLERRRNAMVEGLQSARNIDLNRYFAAILSPIPTAPQDNHPMLHRTALWYLEHSRHPLGDFDLNGHLFPTDQTVWCPISRDWRSAGRSCFGALIIPVIINCNVLEKLLGLQNSDVVHMLNCLPMDTQFANAWKSNVFMILPSQKRTSNEEPQSYKMILLDETLRDVLCFYEYGNGDPRDAPHRTWAYLDGRQLAFQSDKRPSHIFLYVRYIMQMLWCSQRGGYEKLFRKENLWILEQSMLTRTFVDALTDYVDDPSFTKLFARESTKEPAANVSAATVVAVREFVEASQVEDYDDRGYIDESSNDDDDY